MRTITETIDWLQEGLKQREADVEKFSKMGNHIRAARNATAVTILKATVHYITGGEEEEDTDNIFITIREASNLLRISRRTLSYYMAKGMVKYYKFPGKGGKGPVRFNKKELIEKVLSSPA